MAGKPTYKELEQKVRELKEEGAMRMRAEKALAEARELFEKIFTSQLDAIFILNADIPPKILKCNPAATELFGYSHQEMMGQTTEFLHCDKASSEYFQKLLYPAIAEHGFFKLPEYAMKRKDGTVCFTEHSVIPLDDNQGTRIGWVSVVRDITQRKLVEKKLQEANLRLKQKVEERTSELQKTYDALMKEMEEREKAETALHENEAKYRTLIENANEGIIVAQDGVLKFVNPKLIELSGYSEDELLSRPFTDFIHPDDQQRVMEYHTRRLNKEEMINQYEIRVILKDGDVRWAGINSVLITWNGRPATLSHLSDITMRKQAEDALRQSEAEKRAILDASLDRIRHVDQGLNILWANKETMIGLNGSFEDLADQRCYKVFVGRDTPCDGCPALVARETGQIERAVMRKPRVTGIEGESYWDIYCVPIIDDTAATRSMIQVARNVTDQKRSEMQILRKNTLVEGINRIFRSTLLHSETDADIAKAFISVAEEVTGSQFGFIAEVNGDGRLDTTAISEAGWEAGTIPGTEAVAFIKNVKNRWPWDRVIKGGKSVIINDPAAHSIAFEIFEGHPRISSLLAAPLMQGHGTFGLIALANKEGGYKMSDQEDLETLATAAVEALMNKRSQSRIHALTHQLMNAQERERQMIARELHDRVAQDLAVSRITCEMLLNGESPQPPEVRQRLSGLSNSLEKTVRAVRDLSYLLRPPSLDEMGFLPALFQYCREFSEDHEIQVDFSSAGVKKLKLNFETESNLYRLVQEGLTNVMKHAEASTVTVKLAAAHPHIMLRIEDNGKGFDVKRRLKNRNNEKRMGLRSMEERVHLLQGTMKIQSIPMKGTKIFIKIPHKKP